MERDRSPEGCRDMAGNVREWTATQGGRPGARVVKGGSYETPGDRCLTYARGMVPVGFRGKDVGFRCARSVP